MAQNLDFKYEAEYFFQTIEMANEAAETEPDLEADFFSWKVVKRRQKPQRRYTVSHAAPPAPPSTPTSHDPISPSSIDNNKDGCSISDEGGARLKKMYSGAFNYKKKFKQQRADDELAELFKVVTITGGREPTSKLAERGVSYSSRSIRRELNADSFKIHRNSNEYVRDLHDEDSLSAPEMAEDYSDRFQRSKLCRRIKVNKYRSTKIRRKILAKESSIGSKLMERMDEIADSFDTAMSFRPAQ